MLCHSVSFYAMFKCFFHCCRFLCYAVSFNAVLRHLCHAAPLHAMLRHPFDAVLFHAMLCHSLPCSSSSCHAVLFFAMWWHSLTCSGNLCHGVAVYAVLCQSTQCCVVLVMLYHAVSCSAEVLRSLSCCVIPPLHCCAIRGHAAPVLGYSCGSAAISCSGVYTLAVGHYLPAPQVHCLPVQEKLSGRIACPHRWWTTMHHRVIGY